MFWLLVWLFLIYMQHVLSLPALQDFDIWADGTNKGSYLNVTVVSLNDTNGIDRDARVLNFFPVPVEHECLSTDGRRKGTCLNPYECRIQGGSSKGPCALGFGVCCVFTATCTNEIFNNITYFVNPDFPDLSTGMSTCQIVVKKIDPEIAQLRLDFIHFNLGQPNRRTGVCQEDMFMVSGGSAPNLKLCGVNSGQHVYYDVENIETPINITMNLSKRIASRLWEVRIIQVPFTQRTPNGCLQYHMGHKGIIQTMNFADNGRHLADQDYSICMRQEEGMCTISYEPCDENSFKISPNQRPEDGGVATDEGQVPGQDLGSGDGGVEVNARNMMEVCADRVVLPCDSEDLILGNEYGPGFCTMAHCGSSFCPRGSDPCRIESSATPFTIGVHFGPNAREEPPEENLGMCLSYEQLPCIV